MDLGFLPSARSPAEVLGTWCRTVLMFPKQAALAGIRLLNIRDKKDAGHCVSLKTSAESLYTLPGA